MQELQDQLKAAADRFEAIKEDLKTCPASQRLELKRQRATVSGQMVTLRQKIEAKGGTPEVKVRFD
jgi:hypothetical protein